MQGIADWSWSSLKAVRPQWLADRQITLLMQGALKNEPELGSLPNALDFIKNDPDRKVMELHFTQKTAARPLVTPPEVPAERVALLRKAFEALAQDTEFLAEMNRAKMEFGFVRRRDRQGGGADCFDAARYRRTLREGIRAGREVNSHRTATPFAKMPSKTRET